MESNRTNPLMYAASFAGMFLAGYICAMGVQNILRGNATVSDFMFFVVGAAGCMVGLVFIASFLMNDGSFDTVKDVVSNDVQALSEGQVTHGMWRLIFSVIATIIFAILLMRFHKLAAGWDWGFKMPVWLVAVVAIIVTRAIIVRTPWYSDRFRDIPWFFFAGYTVLFAVALVLGIYKTEDVRLMRFNYQADQSSYNYYHYSSYHYYSSSDSNSNSSSSDSDSDTDWIKNLGEGIICLIILVVFALLIIGAAFIGSFWVVSGSIFLTFMWSDTWQALQMND